MAEQSCALIETDLTSLHLALDSMYVLFVDRLPAPPPANIRHCSTYSSRLVVDYNILWT